MRPGGQEVVPADADSITCTALRIGTRTDSHASIAVPLTRFPLRRETGRCERPAPRRLHQFPATPALHRHCPAHERGARRTGEALRSRCAACRPQRCASSGPSRVMSAAGCAGTRGMHTCMHTYIHDYVHACIRAYILSVSAARAQPRMPRQIRRTSTRRIARPPNRVAVQCACA